MIDRIKQVQRVTVRIKRARFIYTAHLVDGTTEVIRSSTRHYDHVVFFERHLNSNCRPGTLAAHASFTNALPMDVIRRLKRPAVLTLPVADDIHTEQEGN